jgi:TatD DNase family protein
MLIDAHAHLDRYGNELEAALREISHHRILTVSNSTDPESYARNLRIAEMSELVMPTFGVHPWHAPEYANRLDDLRDPTERSPMLGEIGLDYHFVEDTSQYRAQRKVFEFFLAAARDQQKVVNLHTKGAEEEVARLLDRHCIRRAIIHWYSGPIDMFRELVTRGLYFTVGVEVLHSEHSCDIGRGIPLEQLLTETDNPGGPEWLTGKRGMPRLIVEVISALAELRQTTPESIADAVRSNFLRLMGDDPLVSAAYAKLAEGEQRTT